MKMRYLPGTNLLIDSEDGHGYRNVLQGVFRITGGIYLSQLSEMIGIPNATLQNWVKRGYVSSPQGKKYSMRQTARILIIALLRQSMSLDDIVLLLSSINHDLADEQDDLIDDSQLYLYFCDLVLNISNRMYFDEDALLLEIDRLTEAFPESQTGDRARLNHALLIMTEAYGASILQDQVRDHLQALKGE